MLVRMLGDQAELNEQLAALDRAIEVNPRCIEAYDMKALCLGRAKRYDEARQACQATVWDGEVPLLLRGRAAWVEAERGQLTEAMSLMRTALAEDPNYYWGWESLAKWARELGAKADYCEAAGNLVRLSPRNSIAHGYLAEALWRQGEKETALERIQQAVRLDLHYDWGWDSLRDWTHELKRRELPIAFARQMTERQPHEPRAWLLLAQALDAPAERDDQLAALDKSLALQPRNEDAYDLKAVTLTQMERFDEALQACEAPVWQGDIPFSLRGRAAWAEHERGNRPEAIERMRAVLADNADYYWGWEHLGKWAHESGDLAGYRTASENLAHRAAQRHRAGLCRRCFVETWRQGRGPGARARIPAHRSRLYLGLGLAARVDAQLDRRDAAIAFARQLTEQRPKEARSWLMLGQVLSEPNEADERLAALDQAIQLNPRLEDAHDLKAYSLARRERYDEARQACAAPVWNGQPPLILRGRAAWIEAERGETEEAIRLMKATVADSPDYYWGWENLADWSRREDANDDYLQASENLVRLAPNDAIPYGYRGDACRRKGDRAGGKADFRHAQELDPTYRYGGQQLFDMQLADGELDDAARTLSVLKEHASDEFSAARAVQLEAARGQRDEAIASLQALCVTKMEGGWPLEAAVAALDKAGWKDDAERVLRESLDLPDAPAHVGSLWIDRHVERKDWRCAQRFESLLQRGESGRSLVIRYVKALAKAKVSAPLHECIRRHGAALRDSTSDWANVGYCFATLEDYRNAADWMRDWSERRDAQPWMFINLAIALRGIGDNAQANRVSRRALELTSDYTSEYHRVWLALDEALTGNSTAAGEWFNDVKTDALDVTHKYVHRLVETLLSVQQAAPAERSSAFRRARQQLDEAVRTMVPLNDDRRALLAAYRRCVRRLAQDRGGVPAFVWSRWRCWRPQLPPAKAPEKNGAVAATV